MFGSHNRSLAVRNAAERPCGRRRCGHAYQQTRTKASLPQLFSQRARRAVRLVWDAIT